MSVNKINTNMISILEPSEIMSLNETINIKGGQKQLAVYCPAFECDGAFDCDEFHCGDFC